MANLALGIDTGGTLTDGVLFDLDSKEILAQSKVFTTREDLTRAIERCLDQLAGQPGAPDPGRIKMAALSTTLATNSIVEGRGGEAGLIMIGFDEPVEKVPAAFSSSIGGGCNLKGEFKEELDLAAAKRAIFDMRGQVDAVAVSGYLSIRNPAQELAVAGLVRELAGCPVVCAHQLSTELGFYERTVTAVLNARLIPLITDLIAAVKKSLERRGVRAPLMVMKGDGSLISEREAGERPIETILSGPAASVIGAITLTGLKDAVVIDMGGTTTDLAVLKEGRPVIKNCGARVGGWLTRVRAADITTAGLGGDSLIHVDRERRLSIGPQRVHPFSGIAAQYPRLQEELKKIKRYEYALYNTLPTMALVYLQEPSKIKLTPAEKDILDLVKEGPHTLYHIAEQLNRDFDLLPWARLARVGAVLPASVTPTDILHLTGAYRPWDRGAARLGAEILARRFNSELEPFIDAVLEEIYFKLAALIAGRLIPGEAAHPLDFNEKANRFFLKEILKSGGGEELFRFSAQLHVPLVAVGAPVGAYFPELAQRLNAKLLIPPRAEVANAVGTVSGQTVERVRILIRPGGEEGYISHAPWGRGLCSDLEQAVGKVIAEGKEYARARAAASGARDLSVSVHREDRYGSLRRVDDSAEPGGPEEKIYIESAIEITAVGRPWG